MKSLKFLCNIYYYFQFLKIITNLKEVFNTIPILFVLLLPNEVMNQFNLKTLKEELMYILLTIYYCNIKVIILLIIYFYMD